MISHWKFPSVKTLQVRGASFRLVLMVVIFAVCLFYGILYHFAIVFLAVFWGYLLIGWALSIARVVAERRPKTLEDVEQEPPEETYDE